MVGRTCHQHVWYYKRYFSPFVFICVLMVHLHWQRRTWVWTLTWISNPMAILYYAEHVHIFGFLLPISVQVRVRARIRQCKWVITDRYWTASAMYLYRVHGESASVTSCGRLSSEPRLMLTMMMTTMVSCSPPVSHWSAPKDRSEPTIIVIPIYRSVYQF